TRHLLGDAGLEPNPMPAARRQQYGRWALAIGVVSAVIVMLFGTGAIEVSASVFAENLAYALTTIAGIYFVYLYGFAGLNVAERQNVVLLFLLFIAAAAFWSGFDQSGGSLNLFARDYTDLNVLGVEMPVSWVQFFNPIYVVVFAPMFAAFWAYLG
ncbi:MAG TPA: MFS transporter, partial [Gammaproteobacteria bacterium]|nr:MFS transporter [Gammaproteobacteria bacterium]